VEKKCLATSYGLNWLTIGSNASFYESGDKRSDYVKAGT